MWHLGATALSVPVQRAATFLLEGLALGVQRAERSVCEVQSHEMRLERSQVAKPRRR